MKWSAVGHKAKVRLPLGELTRQQRSHSSRRMVYRMPSRVMSAVKLGELDLMLDMKVAISVDQPQLESVKERNRNCQIPM
jgi:hypothetical protein